MNENPDVVHLGCMVHARRPFAELVKLAKTTGKSHKAVAFFQKLYAIEKIARKGNYFPAQRHALRLQKSKPILNEMKIWLEQSLKHAVPQSKLANALHYMHERWQQLTNFLLDGALEIDNNGLKIKLGLSQSDEKIGCSQEALEALMPVLYFIASLRRLLRITGIRLIIYDICLKTFAPAKHPMIILICCHSTSSQK